jgi:GNAT superfamily N-acetyltransferase
MQVREIDTEKPRDVREFVQVPFELYRGCEQWVPPIVSSMKLALNRNRHPFYKHSDAGFFVAEEGGAAVGRIAVLENRHYNDYRQAKVAFFYYFDSVDDVEVARGLIEIARTWANARGLTLLMGPKGMLRSDPYGVLIEGYEYFAGMTMPYNYPYYASLLESIGMEKEIDYVSGYMVAEDEFPDRLFRLVERIKERSGFWVKSFKSKRELRRWIPAIQRVNNEAFTQVWGYYPIDDAEVQMIGDQLLLVSDPRLMKVVMKGDDIAGFAFVFPDIGEALKATGGRMWPFGWARLLVALRRTKRLMANGVGLLPEHQGLGASALLYAELSNTVRQRGADYGEFVQVMETNINSLGDMNMLGVQWHKRHRVYRIDV